MGYVVNHKNNDAIIAVNRLLKANEEAFFVGDRSYQSTDGTGVIFITAKPTTKAVLDKAALDLGLNFTAVTSRPAGAMYKLTKPRIGLWDQYGGSMPSGHLRWLLEQFEFDFERVFPQTLDAGNLKAKYDVILFPDGGIPETDGGGGGLAAAAADASRARTKFPRSIARISAASRSRDRAEAEGVRGSRRRDRRLRRIRGARSSPRPAGQRSPRRSRSRTAPSGRCPGTKYYIPGAMLQVAVDNTNPLAFGFEKKVDVFFDNSPVMELAPNSSMMRRQAGGVVRLEAVAALRMGVGPALSRRRHRRHRSVARQGQGVPVRTGDHLPRAAARDVQVPVQLDLLRHLDAELARSATTTTASPAVNVVLGT